MAWLKLAETYQVDCPFCEQTSTYRSDASLKNQASLICENCGKNIARLRLKALLNLQKRQLKNMLLLCILIVISCVAVCYSIVSLVANDFRQLPFLQVLCFSASAILAALSVAVIIVLIFRLHKLKAVQQDLETA